MNFDELLNRLKDLRGTGLWGSIAKDSGIHYDTLARIIRGVHVPDARLKERIEAAVLKFAPVAAPAPVLTPGAELASAATSTDPRRFSAESAEHRRVDVGVIDTGQGVLPDRRAPTEG